MTRYWLKVGESYRRLDAGDTIVGRSSEASLRLQSSRVSRRHARFRQAEDVLEVHDLGSRNGVLVNGERIEGAAQLSGGDRVTIGPYTLEVWSGRDSRRNESMRTMEHKMPEATAQVPNPDHRPKSADASGPDASTAMQRPNEMMLSYVRDALRRGDLHTAQQGLPMLLERLRQTARRGKHEDHTLLAGVSHCLLETTERTGDRQWLDALFRTNAEHVRVLGGDEVDRVRELLPRMGELPAEAYAQYVEQMRQRERRLPVEARAALRRIEGLRRLLFPGDG